MEQDSRQQRLPKRCAIYARSAHRNGVGINEQLALCKLYAVQEGWTVVNTTVDKGPSAFNQRHGLRALLEGVRDHSHPIDIVLVADGRRLSERSVEMVWTFGKIREAGAEVMMAFDPLLPGDVDFA